MTREEAIQYLLDNMITNPTPKKMDWKAYLAQMTDDELQSIARIKQLDDAVILTKDDLDPFIKIIEKHNPGSVGVVLEHHDPEVDLFERRGRIECHRENSLGLRPCTPK